MKMLTNFLGLSVENQIEFGKDILKKLSTSTYDVRLIPNYRDFHCVLSHRETLQGRKGKAHKNNISRRGLFPSQVSTFSH